MQLPAPKAAYQARVRYGSYVARRLRRAKRPQLADDVLSASKKLRELGRALEDTDDTIQEALADRDAADDDLDTTAQEARAKLAGRSLDAVNQLPYTAIFDKGITYYTAAPLDEEVKRYGELKQRAVEHLPATDEVRKDLVKGIDSGIKDFKSASDELASARTADSLAATRLATATDNWSKQMEKTYGALVTEIGRTKADRFFPRISRKVKGKSDSGPGEPGTGG